MRACRLHQPAAVETAPLRMEDVPVPEPGVGQVLIRVKACGICRTDLHVIEGELPPRRRPVTPGHQVVGEVVRAGSADCPLAPGARVGVAWLHSTCGACRFCRAGQENLCLYAGFTGYTQDGGFADYLLARQDFVYPIPEGFPDVQAAPLLCAGIIGYRCLRLSGIRPGDRLGLYGFGAAAHVAIQVAQHWGATVYACTRDERHRLLAIELGAAWAGGTTEKPPEELDAAIVFAPAGEIVPAALGALRYGGSLILGGIHMSTIPALDYDLLYHERSVKSVANNTRQDGREFLELAAAIPIHTQVRVFPLEEANEALDALKNDAFQGAGVLLVQA